MQNKIEEYNCEHPDYPTWKTRDIKEMIDRIETTKFSFKDRIKITIWRMRKTDKCPFCKQKLVPHYWHVYECRTKSCKFGKVKDLLEQVI